MRLAIAVGVLLAIAVPARAEPDAGSWVVQGVDVDGGVREIQALPVFDAVITVELPDGGPGPTVPVNGGCWLSEAACMSTAKELADKRERVKYLEAHSADAPTAWLTGAFIAGAALGAASAFCATEPGHCDPLKLFTHP